MAGKLIHKRKNSWVIRIHKGRDPLGKKRIYKTIKFVGDRKAARAELDRLFRAQAEGRELTPPDMTINEYFDRWFETVAENRYRYKTLEGYKESSHLTCANSSGRSSFRISSRAILIAFSMR